MNTIEDINSILDSENIAVAGVSENPSKFGTIVYRNLKSRGYRVYPVNPRLSEFDGQRCWSSVDLLPDDVEALVCVTPPGVTEELVRAAVTRGIKKIWMQPGAESALSEEYCRDNGITSISHDCIMKH